MQYSKEVFLRYSVNVLTRRVAAEVLQHRDVLDAQAAAIRSERSRLFAGLRGLPGVEAYASVANFTLFRVAKADQVFSGLKQRGVLIKNLHGSHPLLADCLRVTVGTPTENAQLLSALTAILNP